MMSNLKHIVYKITNLLNGMIYVGKHSTGYPYNMKGYWSRNIPLTNARKKYGNRNFKREILFVFDIEEEAYTKEREIVTLEFVNRKDTYNLMVGGDGGSSGENNYRYGKHHKEATKKKISLDDSIVEQRRLDIKNEFKTKGYRTRLAIKWNLNSVAGVSTFIRKYASDLVTTRGEVTKQRLLDIKNEVKVRGWKTKLALDWGVKPNTVSLFLRKYALDLDTKIDSKIEQRKLDVIKEPKIPSWKSRLAEEWEVTVPCVNKFIKKYTPKYTSPFLYVQRLMDIKKEPKVWGWKSSLGRKWGVDESTVHSFIAKYGFYLNQEVINV